MGHVSRLQKAIDRAQIGHDGSYLPISIVPPPAVQPQQQLGIEALVPMLTKQGAVPGYRVHVNRDIPAVAVVATCGPVEIPLPFSVADARKLAEQIGQACDQAEAPRFTADPAGNTTDSQAPATPDETEGRLRPDDAPEHRSLAIRASSAVGKSYP